MTFDRKAQHEYIVEGKKRHAKEALLAIQAITEHREVFYKYGVNFVEFPSGLTELEKCIAMMFSSREEDYAIILDYIQWWLYEDVKKVIWVNKKKVNVSTASKFVEWLYLEYSENLETT